jgi:predicted  nucleic acid-binding Zn-ribbon protein
MEAATTLAVIILIVAILILIYYYLQATNNPVYQDIHEQAEGFTARVSQEEYISNISDKMSDISGKFKDRVQDEDDGEHVSKTDLMSKKISQFIDEQSEHVINDWDLATNKDIDSLLEKYESIESNLNEYKQSNDKRVDSLEERVNRIDEELEQLKD